MNKILIFGAGKIGRSFVGQLFASAGYTVVFADIDPELVRQLNSAGSYRVHFVDSHYPGRERMIELTGISAVGLSSPERLIREITEADIAATCVGKRGLKKLIPLLATGIEARFMEGKPPLDIILAENIREASRMVSEGIKIHSPSIPVDAYVGLVETSIGKMVPIHTSAQLEKHPLDVYAEPYNDLILDGAAFKNEIPDVGGLVPKTNINAWVDRKLFIHNLGHAALAYHAHALRPELSYTWQAVEDKNIRSITRRTMIQSSAILYTLYPSEFEPSTLEIHIDDLLERFSNRGLGDTIFRVGCDLPRKLNTDDRLMVPILAGIERGMDVSLILMAWIRGCRFDATDGHGNMHPADRKFIETFGGDPLRILQELCNFDPAAQPVLFELTRTMLSGTA